MDAQQKERMAQGRTDARAVKGYLEYLDAHKPRRGRRRTKESIAKRLAVIETELESASALIRLNLVQEQMNLQAERAAMDEVVDGSELRSAFVDAAGRYAESKGISADAFRQMGVDNKTLKDAGIK